MPSPEQIASAGPWAVLVFFLAAFAVGVIKAWQSGAFVPKRQYAKKELENRALRGELRRNTKAVQDMAATQAEIVRLLTADPDVQARVRRDAAASEERVIRGPRVDR